MAKPRSTKMIPSLPSMADFVIFPKKGTITETQGRKVPTAISAPPAAMTPHRVLVPGLSVDTPEGDVVSALGGGVIAACSFGHPVGEAMASAGLSVPAVSGRCHCPLN